MRVGTFALISMAVVLGALPAQATGPVTSAQIELGRKLFEAEELSTTGKVSCASCHDPDNLFTDGLPESPGVTGLGAGRNSPSLVSLSLVKSYPGIRRQRDKRRDVVSTQPAVLSLAERCVAPIENPIEMGDSVEAAVDRLRRERRLRREFDRAFPDEPRLGVTRERLGCALAAYVASLELPDAPYRCYLHGDFDALTPVERAGLAVFNGRGRCNTCHSGPALSDGLVHAATLPDSMRAQEAFRETRERFRRLTKLANERRLEPTEEERRALGKDFRRKDLARLREAQRTALSRGSGGYYGVQQQVGAQTLPLWDVARTGRYFRDGSVQGLEQAIRQHVEELQAVALFDRSQQLAGNPGGGLPSLLRRVRVPRKLVATFGEGRTPPLPDDLDEREMGQLLAFLRALSPRAGRTLAAR